MDLARAAVQHALDVGDAYKQNMALKHGLEQPERIRLSDKQVPVAQAIPLSPERYSWSPLAVSAAVGLSGLVSAASGWLLATGMNHSSIKQPVKTETVIERPAERDDLLSYLQERGAHLPPKDNLQ